MSVLKNFGKSLFNAMEMAGRAKTLAHLEGLSDRTLNDLGFSRSLMRQGVSAWPWKKEQEIAGFDGETSPEAINAAVEELNAYNDFELADLGLARHEIRDAVVNGRKDIERNHAA